jgi:hypothetical protein
MKNVIRNVGELDANDRLALEKVVGRKLYEDERLVIEVVSPTMHPSVKPAAPGAILPDWCDVYAGLTDEEVDELDRAIVRSPSSRNIP